jgi:CRISPR-associated RAMP protein (TIGR02581 family)
MFDRFTSRISVTGKLTAETGLHIGVGGSSLDPAATDSRIIRDALGRPFIPGSSFKGALRAHLESILRALGRPEPSACDPLADPCIWPKRQANKVNIEDIKAGAERDSQDKGRTNQAIYDSLLTRAIVKESCTICKVFGSPWLASRVLIKDLFIDVGSYAGRLELRDGVGIDRDTGAARQGIKYDFEVVPALATFDLRIVIENPDPNAFGLLAVGLQELEGGRIAVGGKTTRGLGVVRLVIDEMEIIGGLNGDGKAALVEYLISGTGKKLTGDPMHDFMKENIKALVAAE